MSMYQTLLDIVAPSPTHPRPQYCYPVVVTESSRFHPDPDDEEKVVAIHKTHIEHVVYSHDFANTLAKHYFIRQHSESDTDSNEDKFGRPTPRACKWGIWVPSNTIKCSISEVQKRCRIEVILGSGPDRLEIMVEVLREKICDANGFLARDDVSRIRPHRITITELMRIEQPFGVIKRPVAAIIKDL